MNYRSNLLLITCLIFSVFVKAQLGELKSQFNKDDTLRGSITEFRKGWDVVRYDLEVAIDIPGKSISGSNKITYNETLPVRRMQIDLQTPLQVDSIVSESGQQLSYEKTGNAWLVRLRPDGAMIKFLPGIRSLTVYYHGVPKAAIRPPWDGGLIWRKDSLNNPFIGTACQGLGASIWWPCKDHQSDEPDSGMTIKLIAPDTLSAISNGRLKTVTPAGVGMKAWTWEVKSPINNYDVTMNIGKYSKWNDTLMGEGGKLDIEYWVLSTNLAKAKKQFEQVKPMLHSHEYWFGKYPFYEDSYKLVEVPFLGMEHQSAVAYGNRYENGYLGSDLSGTGWGLKWDFIIIHESGHEWFGNNITTNDVADMWVHEGFTNYSETLYTEHQFGKEAGYDYSFGTRKKIRNDRPIIGFYGVNKEGSGDMYYKGGNMLHLIRNSINNDQQFRNILRGLNDTFYHKTVTTQQVEAYISLHSGMDLSKVFDQYLRTVQLPVLEYYYSKNKKNIYYRWSNCVPGFDLSLVLKDDTDNIRIYPTEKWAKNKVNKANKSFWLPQSIERNYYIGLSKVKGDE